jgi:hypothetical protein
MTPTFRRALVALLALLLLVPVTAATGAPPQPVDPPVCDREDRPGQTERLCTPDDEPEPEPQPNPEPEPCVDVVSGLGQFRGISGVDAAGTVLVFAIVLEGPSCAEATYTTIARDADTLAVLGTATVEGVAGLTHIPSAFQMGTYTKQCIAVDVVVTRGDVLEDVAPDSRPAEGPHNDLCRGPGAGGQNWS